MGILVGLTGVGGRSLMTPLLVLAFGFHPATAVGTDLLYASATKSVGAAVHGVGGTVDWLVVRRLASGSVPATILTLLILSTVGAGMTRVGYAISVTLSIALMATAAAILLRGAWHAAVDPKYIIRGRQSAFLPLYPERIRTNAFRKRLQPYVSGVSRFSCIRVQPWHSRPSNGPNG